MSASLYTLDPKSQKVAELTGESAVQSRDGSEKPPRRWFTLPALNAVLAWRPLAVLAYVGSAASFLIDSCSFMTPKDPGVPKCNSNSRPRRGRRSSCG